MSTLTTPKGEKITYTSETIEDIHVFTCIEVINCTFSVDFERVYNERVIRFDGTEGGFDCGLTLIHLDIHRAPPDLILGRFLIDNALVFGAASGLLSGEIDQSSGRRYDSTLIADSILIKLSNRSVALQLDTIHVETGLGEVLQVTANH